MLVVTGIPRSGTSFVMNTLRKSGYRIAGEPFLKESGPKEFNPDGYWELPIAQIYDGIDGVGYDGVAVKLFGLYANLSDVSSFEGLIYCIRNRKDAVRSMFRLLNESGVCCGAVAWLIAEQSYDIHKKHADEVYSRARCKKTVLSIDRGTLVSKNIKEFVKWA